MPPRGRGRGRGRGGRGAGTKSGKAAAAYAEPDEDAPAVALPALQEDVWVQCDACQKWRRLPPGTVVDDDAAWYCTQNPDPSKNSCSVPEENYDAEKEVVIASTDPFYAGLVNKDADSMRKEILIKAGYLPADTPDLGYGRRKGQTPEPGLGFGGDKKKKGQGPQVTYFFGSIKEELTQLTQACQQLLFNAGRWVGSPQGSQPQQQSSASSSAEVPPWVWSGLSHFAPEAAQVAIHAQEVVSAVQAFSAVSQPEGGPSTSVGVDTGAASEELAHAQSLAQLALLNAAALVLPRAQAAAADPSQISLPAAGQAARPGSQGGALPPMLQPSHAQPTTQPAQPSAAKQLMPPPAPPPAIPMPHMPQGMLQQSPSGGMPGFGGLPQGLPGSTRPGVAPGAFGSPAGMGGFPGMSPQGGMLPGGTGMPNLPGMPNMQQLAMLAQNGGVNMQLLQQMQMQGMAPGMQQQQQQQRQ